MAESSYLKIKVETSTGTVEYDGYSYTRPDDNLYNNNRTLELCLNYTDYATAKKVFNDVKAISIINTDGLECYATTDYTGFGSIQMGTFMSSLGNDAILINMKSITLEEKVKKLEEKIDPKVDEVSMSEDDYRTMCWEKLNEEANKHIVEGLDIETASHGTQHFTYDDNDQKNILTLATNAMATKIDVPYHAQNSACMIYSWEDMAKIYITLQKNLLYHTTYVNALHELLKTKYTKETMKAVTYGQQLEGEILNNMNAALAQGQKLMEAVLKNYNVDGEVQPDDSKEDTTGTDEKGTGDDTSETTPSTDDTQATE